MSCKHCSACLLTGVDTVVTDLRADVPQLIPEDYEYDSSGDPVYVSSDQSSRIEEGAEVRIRVVGVRIDASEMVSAANHHCCVVLCLLSAVHSIRTWKSRYSVGQDDLFLVLCLGNTACVFIGTFQVRSN